MSNNQFYQVEEGENRLFDNRLQRSGIHRQHTDAKDPNETITARHENQISVIALDLLTYMKDAADLPKEIAAMRKDMADLKLRVLKIEAQF